MLLELVELVAEVKPHAVLIAGDLYDRGVPPTDAVDLLDHVLTTIVLGHGVPVVAIAGNHDSPKRVGFGSAMLRERGLHLVGELRDQPQALVLGDEHGPVHVSALPFADADGRARGLRRRHPARPGGGRSRPAWRGRWATRTTSAAWPSPTPSWPALWRRRSRSGPSAWVGPAACRPQVFAGFDYVALGHLHRPQQAGAPEICYAGSLMKYSFAEHDHHKSVSVVEIGAPGSADGDAGAAGRARVTVERVALHPPRDVRRLQGTLAELLQRGRTDPRRDDYVLAALLDTGAILDAVGRLREVYPNTLAIERPAL